jgi:Rab GDP dissociation inhibitor
MNVCKVPANDMEALKSPLMGLFEKKRVIGLYKFIQQFNPADKSTWKDMDCETIPMQ